MESNQIVGLTDRDVVDLLNRIPAGFVAVDRQWRITYLNRRAREILSGALESAGAEPIGLSIWDAFPHLRGSVYERSLHRVMDEWQLVEFEDFVPDVNRWYEVHAQPSTGGLLAYLYDVTGRKRSEQLLELRAATLPVFKAALDYKERLAMLAQVAVPVFADWCIVDVLEDTGVRRLPVAFGDQTKDSLANDIGGLALNQHDPQNPIARVLRTGAAEFVPEISEDWLQRVAKSPGRDRLVRELGIRSIMILPLVARGRTLGAMTFITAESRRPYSYEDLQVAEELAQQAALALDDARLYLEVQVAHGNAERRRIELERVIKSRSMLMRRMSHDVKNPLGAADGYAQLLEHGTLGELAPRQQEGVRRIRRSIQAALRLIYDLLEVARAEPGHIAVEMQGFDVHEIVREVVESYSASTTTTEVQLTVDLPKTLPLVYSDAARVRQVMGNLLSNALKFTLSGGRVTLTARVCEGDALTGSARILCLDLTDTGPGIPIEMQGKIFDEFASLESEPGVTSGLGLAMSRRIAWALGGDLTVASALGQGSTFTLSLPLDDVAKDMPPESQAPEY